MLQYKIKVKKKRKERTEGPSEPQDYDEES